MNTTGTGSHSCSTHNKLNFNVNKLRSYESGGIFRKNSGNTNSITMDQDVSFSQRQRFKPKSSGL